MIIIILIHNSNNNNFEGDIYDYNRLSLITPFIYLFIIIIMIITIIIIITNLDVIYMTILVYHL